MKRFCSRWLPPILVILMGIAAYAKTFEVPFVFDDEGSIIQNETIRSLDNFLTNSSGYDFLPNRYIAYLTFAINYRLGGLDVSGYHAVNLAIHLLTALLVYSLLRLTFRTPYFQDEVQGPQIQGSALYSLLLTPHAFIPLFAALLFVAHPVQTQAVTYVVQRLTSLATMFYLLSMVLYVKARLGIESRDPDSEAHVLRPNSGDSKDLGPGTLAQGPWTRSTPFLLLAGATVSAILAMKTKEIAFTLPFAILLYEMFFFEGSWKRRLLCLLPMFATLPIIPLTVMAAQGGGLAEIGEQTRVQTGMSRLDYLLNQFRVIVTYLRLLVLPIQQNLDYDYPVYTTLFTPPVFLSFLLLAALFAMAAYLFWRTSKIRVLQVEEKSGLVPQPQPGFLSTCLLRLTSFGILWFFLTLAVESSFIPIVDVIAEHRVYLPGFGVFTAFAAIFWVVSEKLARTYHARRLFRGAVLSLLVLSLGLATWQRNHIWGDKIRLWQDVVSKSPNKGRAINNLGVALEEIGRRSEAFNAMSRAVLVDPEYYKSYYNLADLYLVSGNPDAALPLLQSAIRLKPDFTEAYVTLGAALMRARQFHEAAAFLERNIERVGGDPEARFYLGSAYAFLGKREAAARELEIISRLDTALAASLAGLLGLNSPHGSSPGG